MPAIQHRIAYTKRRGETLVACLLLGTFFVQAAWGEQPSTPLQHRWFYVSQSIKNDQGVEIIKSLVDTAAEHGLNGMVLQVGWDHLLTWSQEPFDRLQKVKAHCDQRGIQLIPLLLSPGYGHGVVKQNPNLVSGVPVEKVIFSVDGRIATHVPDTPISLDQGGFERVKGDQCRFFSVQDEPGETTLIDRSVAHSGQASLRMQSGKKNRQRFFIPLKKPNKNYVVRFWAKTADAKNRRIAVCIYDKENQRKRSTFQVTDQWTKIETTVATLDQRPNIVVGWWGKETSPIWIDDLEVVESGLANVLRRPGTPVTVKDAKTGVTYEEGKDYSPISDPLLDPIGWPHESPQITLADGSRIKDGDQLSVSAYVPVLQPKPKYQPVLSIAEPEVYEIWEKIVSRVQQEIAPETWLLDVDEVRGGCTDQAAKKLRNDQGKPMTPGEILGQCITRQYEMIRRANPEAEVAIWSDMLDPLHNAKEYYSTVPGGYANSWQYVPRDLIIACWYDKIGEKSFAHFTGLNFRVLAAAYYDADDLENCRQWLGLLGNTPKSVGIMYTTWEKKYRLLGPFGDLVSESQR